MKKPEVDQDNASAWTGEETGDEVDPTLRLWDNWIMWRSSFENEEMEKKKSNRKLIDTLPSFGTLLSIISESSRWKVFLNASLGSCSNPIVTHVNQKDVCDTF